MGLDNGFLIKFEKGPISREKLPSNLIYLSDQDFEDGIEIAYFRKDWGLRNAIISYLSSSEDGDEKYEYDIYNPQDILEIVNIILYFMNPVVWEEEGDSIWTYEQAAQGLKNTVINLMIMYFYMQNTNDVYISFYDSY